MALILLDALGIVCGRGAGAPAGPPWLADLSVGSGLAERLRQAAAAGDADASALQQGLQDLLAGRLSCFEHHHGGWHVALQACVAGSSAAAVLMVTPAEALAPDRAATDRATPDRQRERLEDLLVSRTVQLAEASAEAEAAGRRYRDGLAQASHEVRTPLNAIVSLGHLLERELAGGADPGPLRRVQTILQSARQVGGVFDAVLAQALGHGAAGLAPADAALPDAADALRQRHAGRRVLLAEDDEVNQLAMAELLTAVGLEVDTADDGREAVDKACAREHALILLDLRMPTLDGMAAARLLRRLPGLQATPIIAISANAFEADREACRAAGMNDFLPKPVDVTRLYALLLHWLDGRPAAAASAVAARTGVAVAADVAMTPLLGLEGIDAARGLASVGGKVVIYRRLLHVFIDTHADDGGRLQRLLQQGDGAAAGALAHRLRGSAATLGLVDVETAAGTLEAALDAGGASAALRPQVLMVEQALAHTLARLQAGLSD